MGLRSPTAIKTLKLPSTMPDGKRTKLHPLLWCVENKHDKDAPVARIADYLGVTPQTVYIWKRKCKMDRNFSLPMERAVQLGKFFSVPASLFRPDIHGAQP